MATERIYHQVRGETGLTDVLINIYDSDGNLDVTDGSMTELGSTGIYYYDYTWTTSGDFLAVFTSAEIGYQSTKDIALGLAISSYTPGTTVSYQDIQVDIGEAYNQVLGTTSTIIGRIIGTAEEDIKLVTATTTGYTQAIRYLSDAYVMNHVLAGLGPNSDVESKLINMRDSFEARVRSSLRRQGKDFDNIKPAWVQVNS